ncbi:hypothetical protein BV378_17365 [Nostoc sp. RF31YmG]|jgi:hypothetical protein|nr:hypothetical protein BV378_17365 [Nostoc sp. RF31YmG]
MSDWSEQKKELKIQQGIRQAEDALVIAIQKALDDSKYGDLEEAQFRNLVRVSDTTESTEVIKNFIRYQVGREEKWGKGKESLAEKIIQDIENLINDLAKKIAQESKNEDSNHILLELTRRYLGYGSRYLVYKRKGKS